MKPDNAAEPAGVRVRRLISVSASGNVDGPIPSNTAHSHGAFIGANNKPANAIKNALKPTTTNGNGLRNRTASAGIVNDGSRPSAAKIATMIPPKRGVAPASTTMRGSQVNIE